MSSKNKVIVRFSPSPTGFLHIGGVRTALFNYLFAKKNQGQFLLRIEDTDQTRFVEGATEQITSSLRSYGIEPDNLEHLMFQSARLDIYKKFVDELIAEGHAYECFCTPERLEKLRNEQTESRQAPKYDRHCLNLSSEEIQKLRDSGVKPVIRLKIPDGSTSFTDLVFGEIKVENTILDDAVLLKSDGFPTYHLANVVDDHEMEISHVFRGEEWIPSTPKHFILYKMFGWTPPQFVHLPVIVKSDRKKLSKRDKAADAQIYLKHFETEAVLNYIAFLGWNPKTEQDIFTKKELIEQFALEKVNRAPAVFDDVKLNWMDKQWIVKKGIGESRFLEMIRAIIKKADGEKVNKAFEIAVAGIVLQRIENFWETEELFNREFMFFLHEPEYAPHLLLWKDTPADKIRDNLLKLKALFFHNPSRPPLILRGGEPPLKIRGGAGELLEYKVKEFLKEQQIGTGEALWPLRVALTGLKASPGPFEIMAAFLILPDGKDIIVRRIEKAIEKLGEK